MNLSELLAATFFFDLTHGMLGVNTSVPNAALTVVGNANITGAVRIGNNLTVFGNVSADNIFVPAHCTAYSNQSQSIQQTTYGLVLFQKVNGCHGITTDGQNFTIEVSGEYDIEIDLFGDKTAGGIQTMEAIILVNGVQQNGTAAQRTVNSNNEVGYFAINSGVSIEVGQNLSVGIVADGANLELNNMGCIACQQNVTARINIIEVDKK